MMMLWKLVKTVATIQYHRLCLLQQRMLTIYWKKYVFICHHREIVVYLGVHFWEHLLNSFMGASFVATGFISVLHSSTTLIYWSFVFLHFCKSNCFICFIHQPANAELYFTKFIFILAYLQYIDNVYSYTPCNDIFKCFN